MTFRLARRSRPASRAIRVALPLMTLLGLGLTLPASAQDPGAITLTMENDVITGSDDSYSNGFGASWVSGDVASHPGGFVKQWSDAWGFLPFVGDEGYETYVAWSVAQEIHTPEDITLPDPPESDQPYAGVLYVDSLLYARSDRWSHAWSLRLGLVGPSSRAHEAQREFHQIIGADRPMGWHLQLPDEPIVNVGLTSTFLWREGPAGTRARWRLLPVGSLAAGTYYTGASVGLYGEVGWNLAEAFGGNSLRGGLNAASMVGVQPQERWSLSFFGGVAGHAVGHYLPLDGTAFKDSRSVDVRPFVGSVTVGSSLRKGRFMLSLAATCSSRAFDGQASGAEFGTLSVSWHL